MSAIIHVQSGIAAGTNYWIDRPVLRIGSDPQCEICLPSADLAAHALTLEYRAGAYRAYNRGTEPYMVGGATVAPGAATEWREGQTAILSGGLQLELEFDGDPRPCPRQERRSDDALEHEDEAASATEGSTSGVTKPKSKTTVQIAVIAICGLATAAFLMMPRGSVETNVANRPTFESIVKDSLDKGGDARVLVQQLQFAQAALVRGHGELGAALFLRLRDRLIHQQDSLPASDREATQRVLDYVQYRLSQM
jgi:hypothetical protein